MDSLSPASLPKLRWCQFRLRTLLIFVTLCALLCSCFASRKSLATWYVARQLRVADTAERELTACMRMNGWVNTWTYCYRVETEDAYGNKVKAWESGEWDRVAVIVITWENGESVRRTLLNRNSLSYVFGE
jgi:hypothetical protein